MEILHQPLVLRRAYFSRPNYLGTVDIGAIENPFA